MWKMVFLLIVIILSAVNDFNILINADQGIVRRIRHGRINQREEKSRLLTFETSTNDGNIPKRDQNLIWSSDLFEGDMVMTKEQVAKYYGQEVADQVESAGLLEKSKQILAESMEVSNDPWQNERNLGIMADFNFLWKARDKNNKVVIPYEFQSTMGTGSMNDIISAMNHIATQTGVLKFIPRTNETDWIYFQSNDVACYSLVGRTGNRQTINVHPNCGWGATVHEICHALGFHHEQSRGDRDNYVTILTDNITPGKEGQFNKKTTNSLGSAYDYASIMHYGAYDFGKQIWRCTPTNMKTDTVVRIKILKSEIDPSVPFCFNVNDGSSSSLFDGQVVNVKPCGENNYANQNWVVESFGTSYNVFRFAYNTSYCLTVDFKNGKKEMAPIIIKKCIEGTFTDQLFVFEQYYDSFNFHWGTDPAYLLTRDKTPSTTKTYAMVLRYSGTDNWVDQDFLLEFATKPTGRSATINVACVGETLKVIDAKGHDIGQRSGLSEQDIVQLQLMYQCASGPRDVNSFCSIDCKCKWKQGNCTNNNQCENGFRCLYDGVSMNRCYPIISPTTNPTLNPSKAPTTFKPTTTPTTSKPTTGRPTKNPTLPTKSPSKNPTTGTPSKTPTNPTQSPTTRPSKGPSTFSPSVNSSPLSASVNTNATTMIGVGVTLPLIAALAAGIFIIIRRRRSRSHGDVVDSTNNNSVVVVTNQVPETNLPTPPPPPPRDKKPISNITQTPPPPPPRHTNQ